MSMYHDYTFRHNMFSKNTIILNSLALYNLWEGEIAGQLSDGKWENSNGVDCWWLMRSKFDPSTPSVCEINSGSYYYRRCPNILAKDLLEVVGDRMLQYIIAGKVGLQVGKGGADNRSAIEKMVGLALDEVGVDEAIGMMKSTNNKYESFDRLELTDEEFVETYNKMVDYINKNNCDMKFVRAHLRALRDVMRTAIIKR